LVSSGLVHYWGFAAGGAGVVGAAGVAEAAGAPGAMYFELSKPMMGRKMIDKKMIPTANPVPLPNLGAICRHQMTQNTMLTIGMKQKTSHHPGLPATSQATQML
jgi:hypothetical protein